MWIMLKNKFKLTQINRFHIQEFVTWPSSFFVSNFCKSFLYEKSSVHKIVVFVITMSSVINYKDKIYLNKNIKDLCISLRENRKKNLI